MITGCVATIGCGAVCASEARGGTKLTGGCSGAQVGNSSIVFGCASAPFIVIDGSSVATVSLSSSCTASVIEEGRGSSMRGNGWLVEIDGELPASVASSGIISSGVGGASAGGRGSGSASAAGCEAAEALAGACAAVGRLVG